MNEIFRVLQDCDRYQNFVFDDDDEAADMLIELACQRVGKRWRSPNPVVEKPKLKKGDFLNFDTAPLIISEKAKNAMKQHWQTGAVELLPMPYRGETYYVVNVLRQIDCLAKKQWQGRGCTQFEKSKLKDASIFMVPQLCTDVFVNESFKADVERLGLTGAIFEDVGIAK